MHRDDDRHHVPAAALRGLERGDVAGASAFLARGGEVDARGPEEGVVGGRFGSEDGQSGRITADAGLRRDA